MNAAELSRRGFFAAAFGALTLGFQVGCGGGAQTKIIKHADQTGELIPNMYVTIKRDGRIGLAINKTEMGQGVTTAYSTLVAEELDVAPEQVDFHFADSAPEYRTSFGIQLTGGSTSAKEGYLPIRKAAASAREMLAQAAASDWQVARSDVKTKDGFVVHEPSGRKVGYGELTTKAARLPVPEEPKLKPRSEFRLIGKQGKRLDSRLKVTGTAGFGMDVTVPSMVKAHILHGPVYGAEPKAVHADAARRMPGVIDVVPLPNAVAIVAEKYWQALAAAKTVEVTWSAGDPVGLDTAKLREGMHRHTKGGETVRDDGNAPRAFEKATSKIDAVYDVPYLAHAPMEPQNATVHVRGDKVEVWGPYQSPTVVQGFVADAVGVDPSDVIVHTTFAGGGFGRRLIADAAAEAAIISKRVKRPVQVIWSRESDITQGFYRPQACAKMRGSMSADGTRIESLDIHIMSQSILLDSVGLLKTVMGGVPGAVQNVVIGSLIGMVGSNTVPDMLATEGAADPPYAIENIRCAFTPVHAKLPVCSWRSVGNSVNGFLVEGFVDELARSTRQDPFEMRRRMLSVKGNGKENEKRARALRVLEAVAAMSKWGTRTAGVGRGIARHFSFESEVAEVADVEIVNGRIKVRRVWAAVDCGIAINPDIVKAQVEGAIIFGLSAALDQEITVKAGVVEQTNFDTFPPLRMHECPEIFVQILDSENNPTGIGEPGLPPLAPAVANAIFDLTGTRLRRLPLQRTWDEVRR